MNLHEKQEEFRQLIAIVAAEMHLPESAVERDYYIVLLLKNLADSEYLEQCVFKGGTSLSKCYPGSIERFSEDIDLTFLGMELTDKACDKAIKNIEKVMTVSAKTEKIPSERSNRSKSMYVWFDDFENKIKLEIGSSVRPDPYTKKTLNNKVRHIYDVYRLYSLSDIKIFLENKEELKRLIRVTKETDSYYLNKRNISEEYDPTGAYAFEKWRHCFNADVARIYQNLHKNLLYTDEPQRFEDAVKVFENVGCLLNEIGE